MENVSNCNNSGLSVVFINNIASCLCAFMCISPNFGQFPMCASCHNEENVGHCGAHLYQDQGGDLP